VSNQLKPCLLTGSCCCCCCCCCCFERLSTPLAPQPRFLLAIPASSIHLPAKLPHLHAPKPLSRCMTAFELKPLGFGISFSAAKTSPRSFHLFDLFLYLFITELSMSNWRRQISFSEIFKLLESYEAGGSASCSLSFLFLF